MAALPTAAAGSYEKKARPASRRRWFQFSLRTLMFGTVVVSILLAGFAWRLQRARRQAEAVATIQKLGGWVAYDFATEKDDQGMYCQKTGTAIPQSPFPSFLRKMLGDDFFHNVYLVGLYSRTTPQEDVNSAWNAVGDLRHLKSLGISGRGSHSPGIRNLLQTPELQQFLINSGQADLRDLAVIGKLTDLRELKDWSGKFDDASLESISNLSNLRILEIEAPQASRAGAIAISKLKNLEELQIRSCPFGDEEIVPLGRLSKLHRLTLSESHISDQGLETIAGLQQLEWLDLPGAPVGDLGMDSLVKLPKLSYVNLIRTRISNSGLRTLAKSKSIKSLAVDQTPIDDDGLAALGDFASLTDFHIDWNPITDHGLRLAKFPDTLERLGLGQTEITDAGMIHLAHLKSLKHLEVQGSDVTSAGAAELTKKLPGCGIVVAPRKKKKG